MKTMETKEYLKSVVEQFYLTKKTKLTTKGLRILEEGHKMSFNQIMDNLEIMKTSADKACVLLMATKKAHDGMQIARICKAVSQQNEANKIINMIEIAFPDSRIATLVSKEAFHELFSNVVRKNNEIVKKAKELRMIIKQLV